MKLNLVLEPGGAEPLFLQIAARVRAAIMAGHVAAGDRLPSARALAAQLAVARGTVDAAYAMLAGEGAIVTRGAAGTVVSDEPSVWSEAGPPKAAEQTPFRLRGSGGTCAGADTAVPNGIAGTGCIPS